MTVPLAHKHLIIRAEVNKPPLVENEVIEWMGELIHDIGMKVLLGPYCRYLDKVGNRGITAMAIIETSHVVLHVWDEPSPALVQLDVYSCSDFTPEQIIPWLAEFYPSKVEYKFLDRENRLEELLSSQSSHDWEDILSKPHQYPKFIHDMVSDHLLRRGA